MPTRTWNRGNGLFEDSGNWQDGVSPIIGDRVVIGGGAVTLRKSTQPQPGSYDGLTITLGSASAVLPAELRLDGAALGGFTTITSTDASPYALLTSVGTSAFQGSLMATASMGVFTIAATTTDTASPADFVLDNGSIDISNGGTFHEIGRLDNHGTINVETFAPLVVDGTLDTVSGKLTTNGPITGTGTLGIGMGGTVFLNRSSSITGVTINFDGPGGLLELGPTNFSGRVMNFQSGDLIEYNNNDFNGSAADYASIESGKLTLRSGGSGGAIVVQLDVTGPAATGVVPITSFGDFQPLIIGAAAITTTVPALLTLPSTIGATDHALKSDVARATIRTLSGATLDGTGIRIGIISDSFNVNGSDTPNRDAKAGYLPLKADGQTSAVQVLADGAGKDEGRAMAEIIHQIAPGAQLYFYTANNVFADAVTGLANAGCQIIVDDIGLAEQFFRPAGSTDTAIEAAVARGVNYFSAAGNDGAQFFEANFGASHASAALYDNTTKDAFTFGNGTPYETIDFGASPGSTTLTLEWDAPVGSTQADSIRIEVFDPSHALVASSVQLTDLDGKLRPGEAVTFTPAANSSYQIALVRNAGQPIAGQFKYLLGQDAGHLAKDAVIADPAAEQGSGSIIGHQLLPDVNTVGAINYANTPAYGNPAAFVDDFSGVGPGTFLFDAAGNRLASPRPLGKPDFIAPDYAYTNVSGGFATFFPFSGTSAAAPAAAAVAALLLQANPTLTTAQITTVLKQSAIDLGAPASVQGAGLIQADIAVRLAEAACFAAGTRIATPEGDVAVETLSVGDAVRLAHGGLATITWLGHRHVDCAAHPAPEDVWPVVVAAGAFGDDGPDRDLWLSPDHAVFVSGVLIPVKHLVDGGSIARRRADAITYHHVQLAAHDVLLAEGLPAESYLPGCGRDGIVRSDWAWEAEACAPIVVSGTAVEAVRERLAAALPHVQPIAVRAVSGASHVAHAVSAAHAIR